MNFRITGLSPDIFTDFFGQLGDELKKLNIIRYSAGAANAFPCRITLQDAAIGDSLLLVNYEHQPAQNAY